MKSTPSNNFLTSKLIQKCLCDFFEFGQENQVQVLSFHFGKFCEKLNFNCQLHFQPQGEMKHISQREMENTT